MADNGRPPSRLIIEVRQAAELAAATVRVQGEVDLATAPALEQRLETLLREGVQSLALDLSAVPFCDVPALNMLLRVESQLRSGGGHLSVYRPCPHLRLMVTVLGLAHRLPLMPPVRPERAGEAGAGEDGAGAA
jgi:anti-sigma B factor antagonist